MRRARRLASMALLALPAVGCKKSQECGALIGAANTTVAAAKKANPPQAPALDLAQNQRSVAALYDALAGQIAALGIQTDELAPHARDYGRMSRDLAAAERKLADSADHRDKDELDVARAEFARLDEQELVLAGKVNGFCLGAP